MIVNFLSTTQGSLISAGGVNERLKGERKARVDGGMSTGGGFRWIGTSFHILPREGTR